MSTVEYEYSTENEYSSEYEYSEYEYSSEYEYREYEYREYEYSTCSSTETSPEPRVVDWRCDSMPTSQAPI
jgi:hypothetical protein